MDVSKYPQAIQDDYQVFTEKCSQCHKLSRPINSDYALPAEWERYVKRMMHKPGSGIGTSEGKKIFDFLVYDSSVRKKAMVDGEAGQGDPRRKGRRGKEDRGNPREVRQQVGRSDGERSAAMPKTYPVEIPTVRLLRAAGPLPRGVPGPHRRGRLRPGHRRGARTKTPTFWPATPNPFASICGRVCAAPCEAKCRRSALDAAISIRALKRFVCERFGVESDHFDLGRVYPQAARSEPAAPSARAARSRWSARDRRACRALTSWRCSGSRRRCSRRSPFPAACWCSACRSTACRARSSGRRFRPSNPSAWKSAATSGSAAIYLLADLRRQGYEAVFLGIGAHKSRELAIEGVQLDGVLRAIEFLLNINFGYRVTLGRKVVVIGGGNAAFDVARSVIRQAERFADMSEAELRAALHSAATALEELTAREAEPPDEVRIALDVAREAIRKGVPEVHMYCLENLDEIPAAREEIEEAEIEGMPLHTRWGPKKIVGAAGKSRASS